MVRQTLDTGKLQQLFDQAPGFMALSSGPEHRFEMVNPSYLRLVGQRDLIGRTVREAFPDLQGQQFFSLLDHVYERGKAVTGRARPLRIQRDPEGEPEERFLDFVFQPITDASGEVTGIFAQGNDVTELHNAELALRESEERFQLIADSAPVPMWVTRLDRKRSFVNRAYVDFLGITYEEAVDFDWRTIIHPEDGARILAESIAGEKSLKTFELVGRYRSIEGWRWIRSVSQPRWGPEGEHIGFIGVAHDVTEAKEAERTLREMNDTLERRVAERTADLSAALDRLQAEVAERQRAEEALRQAQKMEAVGQLTGGIAHDFNNLLTPIMGGLEIIASRATDARMKRIAETALESARRGAKLTGQLLAFSRIQRISMAPVAVNAVIENMQDLLRHSIGPNVAIETRLHPEAGHGVCDPNQLENAILNLAINARDAMPDGGRLTIATCRAAVAGDAELEPGDYVRISVGDTGEGMSPEVIARAVEPFFSTKPLGKGTGLGLPQVYGIARQSGGTIRIESEVGKGTRVDLLIPAAAASEAGKQEEAEGAAPPRLGAKRGGSILVIDDDSDVRAFLADSLEGLGYSVTGAEDGRAGLEQLGTTEPDLVLLDYAMPGMNGADVAREARRRRPDLPIIFVSGYAETDQLEAALGADVPVLRKPFSVTQLAAAVEAQIAAKKGAAPTS